MGATYYSVVDERLARVSDAAAAAGHPPPWKLAVELVRCLILAAVVAGLASRAKVAGWTGGLLLGLVLWIGFPFQVVAHALGRRVLGPRRSSRGCRAR